MLCAVLVGLAFVDRGGAEEDCEPEVEGGLVTLYAFDDIQCAFDFRTASPGARVDEGQVVIDEAQIIFNVFREDAITCGFTRDERVNVVDLGDLFVPVQTRAQDRSPRFSFSVFHTLFRDGAHFAFVGPGNRVTRLPQANRILDPLPPEGFFHLKPRIGHTYLLRSKLAGVGGSEEFAKFEVVDFLPGHSLTLRWAPVL